MVWAEPGGEPIEHPVRLTKWHTVSVERARPFPQTVLPDLPAEFTAVDLSPDSHLGTRHVLFLHRVDQDPFDAGLSFWSNFGFLEVDAGLWTRASSGDISALPSITAAEVTAFIDALDQEPYCARDATECITTQTVCHQAEDGGVRECAESHRIERCLVDGGLIDGG